MKAELFEVPGEAVFLFPSGGMDILAFTLAKLKAGMHVAVVLSRGQTVSLLATLSLSQFSASSDRTCLGRS